MILFLVRLVRLVFALLVVRLVSRAIGSFLRGRGPASRPASGPARGPAGADLVRDRVCRTYVPRGSALEADVGSGVEYFCGPACRERARTGLDSGAPAVQSQAHR